MDKIYILHEYGSNNHYNGLQYLCDHHRIKLIFREFQIFRLVGSGIKHKNIARIIKQITNLFFLINLLFTSNKTIVLAIAPYNWRLKLLSYLLRNHKLYWHTSNTFFDPQKYPFLKNIPQKRIDFWKYFINFRIEHIFAVTEKTKKCIIDYFDISPDKISVVSHSYRIDLHPSDIIPSPKNFIYVGRIDSQKGIEEICDYFIQNPHLYLTLVGKGNQENYVKNIIKKHINIKYLGYISDINKLMTIYQKNAFFLLNSKQINYWEELFGQVLIESMACGCIPIAVSHSGPKEIIENNKNGILFEENQLKHAIDKATQMTEEKYLSLRNEAIIRGRQFYWEKISERWLSILK